MRWEGHHGEEQWCDRGHLGLLHSQESKMAALSLKRSCSSIKYIKKVCEFLVSSLFLWKMLFVPSFGLFISFFGFFLFGSSSSSGHSGKRSRHHIASLAINTIIRP